MRKTKTFEVEMAEPVPNVTAGMSKGESARRRIIEVAEMLFSKHGFEAASMRDIAAAANMQPASMYYHFPSKDAILWAVWEKGGLELEGLVLEALKDKTDPWERLEVASAAHVRGLLGRANAFQVLFIMPPQHYPPSVKDNVVALRDRYESIFVDLVSSLPLSDHVDRHYVRLTLIGALSWPLFWYKAERDSPETIAKNIFEIVKNGLT
jgi:TetR/AcrR family transcriptional regulator, cholesterol catabolism regulator